MCAGPRFSVDGLAVVEPHVERRDGIADSPAEVAQTANLLHAAQAASHDTLVRMVHPDWDDDQVAAEVAQIHQEAGTQVPDPMQLGALP